VEVFSFENMTACLLQNEPVTYSMLQG